MTSLDLRNIVWPIRPKPEPNGVQRLARVLHWGFASGALACLIAIPFPGEDRLGLLGAVVGLAMFGRVLRYIMAGE